jgi:hypothetical protein
MTVLDSLNILTGLDANGSQPSLATWNERAQALVVALATAPDGLSYEEQWGATRGGVYDDKTCRGALKADRYRFGRKYELPLHTSRSPARTRLELLPEAIDAWRFLEACAKASGANPAEALDAWREALSIWPRSMPLAQLHPYVEDPDVFAPLEGAYRDALISFGRAVVDQKGASTEAVRVFKGRAEVLLEELAPLFTNMNGDGSANSCDDGGLAAARELRHLMTQMKSLQPMPQLDEVAATYVEHYRRQCGYVCPQRLPHDQRSQDIVVPLSEIFISLKFGPDSSEEIAADYELSATKLDEGLQWRAGEAQGRLDRLVQEKRWLVALGDPGSGKTTLLQWLALQHANAISHGEEHVTVPRQALGLPDGPDVDLGVARLPIMVSLAEYGETALVKTEPGKVTVQLDPLRDFLSGHAVLEQPVPLDPTEVDSVISTWFAADRVLILLDGMDEVRSPDVVREVAKRVVEFCAEFVPDPNEPAAFDQRPADDGDGRWRPILLSSPAEAGGNQAVITSREGGYGRAPLKGPFTIIRTCELGDDDVFRFVDRWCRAVEEWQARLVPGRSEEEVEQRAGAKRDELGEILDAQPGLRRVARNPLILTVLTLVLREDGTPLPTRYALFSQLASVLVSRRSREWRYPQTIDVLGPVALWMQSEGLRTLHREELEQLVRAAIEQRIANRDVERHVASFLTSALEESGLLIESSVGYYGFFAHNIFREFFAALELTRDLSGFADWATEHLDDPHWREVLLLGIASASDKRPTLVDDLLPSILASPAHWGAEQGEERPDLLHRHVLLSGSALLEMDRGTPETVEMIVEALIEAGTQRRTGLHRQLREQIAHTIAAMLDSNVRSRQVEPVLIAQLSSPEHAAFVCDAVRVSDHASVDLLVAVDIACDDLGTDPTGQELRAALAVQLRARGVEIDRCYEPLPALADECEVVLEQIPELSDLLRRFYPSVNPPIHRFVRHLIARGDVSKDQAVDRLLLLLREARGASFASLATVGLFIDPERVNRWILEQIQEGAVDTTAAAGYLSRHQGSISELLQPEDHVIQRLLLGLVNNAQAAGELAFPVLAPGSPEFEPAWRCLARCATQLGSVPLNESGMSAIGALLDSPDTRAHGEILLAKSVLLRDYSEDTVPLLEEATRTAGPTLAAGAALILVGESGRPVTVEDLSLIGELLKTGDGPLRQRALSVLGRARPAAAVPDEVIALSHELMENCRDAGDAAAAYALSGVAEGILHDDANRLLRWAEEGLDWRRAGAVHGDHLEEVLSRLVEVEDELRAPVLSVCLASVGNYRWGTAGCLEPARRICEETESEEIRVDAAELFGIAAVRAEHADEIVPLASDLASRDPNAAAALMRAAAWRLAYTPNPKVSAELMSVAENLETVIDRPWLSAAVVLALDATVAGDHERALARLSDRTASPSEAARALLYAVSGDWVQLEGGMEDRIGTVAEALAASPVGMRALLSVCSEPLAEISVEGTWQNRRGALRLMYLAACRHPALFMTHAPTRLRECLIDACHDPRSYSVRRDAFALVARCPPLDSQTVALIKDATRDHVATSYPMTWHLRHQADAAEVRADLVDEIKALLDDPTERTVYSAAVLLVELARRAPRDGAGADLSAQVRAALADRITEGGALLTMGRGRGILSLKETLEVLLLESEHPIEPLVDETLLLDPWKPSHAVVGHDQSLLEAIEATITALGDEDPSSLLEDGDLDIVIFKPTSDDSVLNALTPDQLLLLNVATCNLLQMRVGNKLAKGINNALLDEFGLLLRLGDGGNAFCFLQAARPDYASHVSANLDALRREAAKNWTEIAERLMAIEDEQS